jgi:hypothetical protein
VPVLVFERVLLGCVMGCRQHSNQHSQPAVADVTVQHVNSMLLHGVDTPASQLLA